MGLFNLQQLGFETRHVDRTLELVESFVVVGFLFRIEIRHFKMTKNYQKETLLCIECSPC